MTVQYQYDEITIRFETSGLDGSYSTYASAPSGEALGSFTLPFSDPELDEFLRRLDQIGYDKRHPNSAELNEVKEFGARLFEALFQGRIRDVFVTAFSNARRSYKGLRIKLDLTSTPRLMHLPWEYLYDSPDFLSTSVWTPVVRYVNLPRPRRPLSVQRPLRILGMVSSPEDMPALDIASEQNKLEQALAELLESGAVELHWLDSATLRTLDRALRHQHFHIFHYVGHGAFDALSGQGLVMLEDRYGCSQPVAGERLGTILRDYDSLRLAVINACEGAMVADIDPLGGVAASLVYREIPAVIAMQSAISDRAAVIFTEEFYTALATGSPVDAALAGARRSIYADSNGLEWATPVLFMRVSDGRIFDVHTEFVEMGSGARDLERNGATSTPEIQTFRFRALEPELEAIPEGPFIIGLTPDQVTELQKVGVWSLEENGEWKTSSVVKLGSFYMGKYPVTNSEFGEFVRATGGRPPKHWEGDVPPSDLREHPVTWVSWAMATAYCQWLAAETGLPYRLPTEEEWEKASRGTDGRRFPWGNRFDPACCHLSRRATAAVYTYSPQGDSPFGVVDTVGNVREWTSTTAVKGSPSRQVRIVRGGGIGANGDKPWLLWCAYRSELLGPTAKASIGFRIAVTWE